MISVITPAHNDEKFMRPCLRSVQAAARTVSETVAHIVVLNRWARIVTSFRKFDQYSDWYFGHPVVVYRIFKRDPGQADQFYYDSRSDTFVQNIPPED